MRDLNELRRRGIDASGRTPAAVHRSARGYRRALGAALVIFALDARFTDAAFSREQQTIGGAEIVVNQVRGALPSGSAVLVQQGDGVYRNEVLRTNDDSNAKLVLLDSTSVSVGPSSSIKLDEFVYAGAGRPGSIALNFVKGAFRFATGYADKRAYSIVRPPLGSACAEQS